MHDQLGSSGDQVKKCCTCKEIKTLGAFNRLTRSSDGRQPSCRDCNRAWHAANKEHHNRLIHATRDRLRRENQSRLIAYLVSHPCVDCGEADPVVLEFDRVGAKRKEVTAMVQRAYSWRAIEAEIENCEVVCANCHRRRTARRAGYLGDVHSRGRRRSTVDIEAVAA